MFALHLSLAALSWRWLLLSHELFRVRKGTVFVVLTLFPGSLCSRSAKHLNIECSHILFMEVEVQHSRRFVRRCCHGFGGIRAECGHHIMDEIYSCWMDEAFFVKLLPSGVVRCIVLYGFVMD